MAGLAPRVVLVTRETDYEALLARHATVAQARFFLEQRGQDIAVVFDRHERFRAALHSVKSAIPLDWRSTSVKRADLDRFLFASDDLIVAIGQDGLVANVAKYLNGQPVLGVNPDPEVNPGVLVPLAPTAVPDLLRDCASGKARLQTRTMAQATLDSGETLLALNELFIGHRSHQSARYRLSFEGTSEDQSSSGIIASTGTGATGWARSIMIATGAEMPLDPIAPSLLFFVREPWPSAVTGTALRHGKCDRKRGLQVTSRMQEGGVVFADGIETDYLPFDWGRKVTIGIGASTLNLVTG